MSVCKQTPKKNVQLVNCPSENTTYIIITDNSLELRCNCCRKKSEGLNQYCTGKGSKVGSGGKILKYLVATSYVTLHVKRGLMDFTKNREFFSQSQCVNLSFHTVNFKFHTCSLHL